MATNISRDEYACCDGCNKRFPHGTLIHIVFHNGYAFMCSRCTTNNIEVATSDGIDVQLFKSGAYSFNCPMRIKQHDEIY